MMSIQFPEAFAARMNQSLREEWDAFALSHTNPAPASIRINPKKNYSSQEEAIPWASFGRYLPSRPVYTLDPLFHAGAYYVQEASSMFLEQAFLQCIENDTAIRVLDLCAAPGGKSTHLLSIMNDQSLLISNEVIRARMSVLIENVQKWGYPNVVVTNNDAEDFQFLQGFFDVIVVDAPCSGEGLFRKDPAAMKEWSEQNVSVCAARQKRILQDIWPALKQNGVLIYSTCTYNQDENELNLKWLQDNHDVEFLQLQIPLEWGIGEVNQNGIIGYHFYPHKTRGEGFFISAIRKKESTHEINIRSGKNIFSVPAKKYREELESWILPHEYSLIQRNDTIQLLPTRHYDTINFLSQRLRIFFSGCFLAIPKHDKLIPEHTLALSTFLNAENFQKVDLTEKEALQFLRKESLTLTPDFKGYALAMFKDFPLGWMNVLPGRINNLYPGEWRIKMS